jgi:hypothetical protein
METLRRLLTFSIAVFIGFLGGAVFTQRHVADAAAPQTIRAHRFELVDDSGKVLGAWGRESNGETALSFLGSNAKPLAALGVDSGQTPFLTLSGTDGRMRADLRVGWGERPFLAMSDEKWAYRVKLGFIGSDMPPTPEDENWGLVFNAPGRRRLAAIGYWKDYSKGTVNGGILVRDSEGKAWRAP